MKTIKPSHANDAPFQIFTLLWLGSIVLFALFAMESEARNVKTSRPSATTIATGGTIGGGADEFADTYDATINSGTIEIMFIPLIVPDTLKVYYPPRANQGKNIYSTGGPVDDFTVKNPLRAKFSGATTMFEIVVNEGSDADPGTLWLYDAVVKDTNGNVVLKISMNQTKSIGGNAGRQLTGGRTEPFGLNRFSTRGGFSGAVLDEYDPFANRVSLRIPTPQKTTTSR